MNNKFTKTRMTSEIGVTTIPFQAISEPESYVHSCYILSTFDQPEDFIECVHIISRAKSGETVVIYLTSGGGSLEAVSSLLMEMRAAKERGVNIVVKGSGIVASAATFVLLEATEFYLDEYTTLLLHSASFGYGGKQQDTKEYVDFVYKQCRKMAEDYYLGILSNEEIDDMIINKREILLTAKEFSERFNKAQEERHNNMMEEINNLAEEYAFPSKEEFLNMKTKKDIVSKLEELGLWEDENEEVE